MNKAFLNPKKSAEMQHSKGVVEGLMLQTWEDCS
jgi:hypothetical protein